MSNEGFLKFVRNDTEKDLVTVIQEETADNLTQSEADNLYLGKTEKASSASTADAVAWTGVSGKPNFATVATTGSYNDLKNKPSIPSSPNAYITASSITNTQQAIKFSNGLIMMSGQINDSSPDANTTITFPYAFTSTTYNIFCFPASIRGGSNSYPIDVSSIVKRTSSCRLEVDSSDGYAMPSTFWWFAIGK